MEETTREQTLEFLESMESRHDDILGELDMLNDRVEKVLEAYLMSRKSNSSAESKLDERVA